MVMRGDGETGRELVSVCGVIAKGFEWHCPGTLAPYSHRTQLGCNEPYRGLQQRLAGEAAVLLFPISLEHGPPLGHLFISQRKSRLAFRSV